MGLTKEPGTTHPALGQSPTIKDVAAAAGVSIATVSRCFSGSDRVREATLEHVLGIARELGYTPSRTAQGLVTGRTANIGVILPDVTNPFFAPLLGAIESAAQQNNQSVFIGDSREDPEAELRLARRFASQSDGIILVSSRLPDDDVLALAARLPVVLANRQVPGLDSAVIDVEPGFSAAVAHLAEQGNDRILYLSGPLGSWSGGAKERALRAACASHEIEFESWGPLAPTFETGRRIADDVLLSQHRAVICYDDLMALGLQSSCVDRRIDMPGSLQIVGCDDALPEGMARPALTTIRGRSDELGRLASELLLSRLVSPGGLSQTRSVTSQLLIRGSTRA